MFTNVWYVALRSDELKAGEVTHKRMLGREFALYRDPAGKPVCLSAVCPHRGASLAGGTCQEDGTLSCPFHGKRFDATGACTVVPSSATPTEGIHPSAKVDSYPTDERFGFVWTFLGDDPEAAHPLFDIPEFGAEGWRQDFPSRLCHRRDCHGGR